MKNIEYEIIESGDFAVNTVILRKKDSSECIIIDSGEEFDSINALIKKKSLQPVALLYTHAHIDHIGSAAELVGEYSLPVYLNSDDMDLYKMISEQATMFCRPDKGICQNINFFKHKDILTFLKIPDLEIKVLYTPGHSAGSSCFYLEKEKLLIAGDTLFAGGIGRTDLPGSQPDKIINSIRSQLFTLPGKVKVIPGHGDETTIDVEIKTNPFLIG